jgi:succinate dehydrogenase / fumarate reductase iron-sulfur subunit
MPAYLLKIRRFDPRSGQAAYWDEHRVELGPRSSVLDAILKVKDEVDGSLGIRCSCQQAICGSCGVRINGKPGLACNTHLHQAAARAHGVGWNPGDDAGVNDAEPPAGAGDTTPAGVIEVEPMGNMPVIRDLIVDMDAVHWKKIQRVTPYLINQQPVPEREYVVPHNDMVSVTQAMGCIQCGACVSDCLSMEIDPLFVGPAALAKAYRFAGDPRDADHRQRLTDLAQDPHGIYECTHCFNCIDACPKGVDPMNQIMRLRRMASSDHGIKDDNNGSRHEHAFVKNIRRNGILHEPDLLADSYGGKLNPNAGRELTSGLPTAMKGLARGKMTVKTALLHPHRAPKVRRIFDTVDGRSDRVELNLYISGFEDDPTMLRAPHTDEPTGLGAPAPRQTTSGAAGEPGRPESEGAADRRPPAEPSV